MRQKVEILITFSIFTIRLYKCPHWEGLRASKNCIIKVRPFSGQQKKTWKRDVWRRRKTHKNDKKKPCLCNDMSCTTTSYVGGGESPLFSDWFANPRAFPLRLWAPLWEPPCVVNCCVCKSVRLMVDVPLVIGAVGDIEVDAGKSGAVSALSWYGRL